MATQVVSNTYTNNVDISIPNNAANIILVVAGGGGGDGSADGGTSGGGGGNGRAGTFTLGPNYVARGLALRPGNRGSNGVGGSGSSDRGVGGAGGAAGSATGGRGQDQRATDWSGGGGGGGGSTGVYDNYYNAWVCVAGGGGGGGGGSLRRAGTGGGFANGWSAFGGSVGSSDGQGFAAGRASGDGGGAGGGGAGTFGGATGVQGADDNRSATGGDGGGSGYYSTVATITSDGANSGDGYVTVQYTLVTPQINSFSASPNPQTSGSSGVPSYSTTLSWNTSDVTSVSISGIGAVGASGSRSITNLPQSTAGSNSPASTSYTLTACAGSTCVSQTITVSAYNDNTPNNFSFSNQSNLEPNTLTTTSTETITGIDMQTLVSAGPNVQVSNNNSTWSSTTLITNGQVAFARATSPSFNTDPSGLTNSSQFYADIGTVRRFFTLTTRAPDVSETFNLPNENDRVPYPDIDTIVTAPDNPAEPYISSNTLNVDDIEIPVEIKTNNSNAQIRVKRAGASSWENWQDTRSI